MQALNYATLAFVFVGMAGAAEFFPSRRVTPGFTGPVTARR
jgi:hypothetical protein